MKFHDTLNEKLFNIDTMEMLPEVKEKLEEIAEAFIEFLEIPTDAVLDKVITGSSASYNYNKYSDLDLHIIVDYDKVHEDCPLVNGYLNSLKKQFNDNHDIFIHGVPVELYAEQKDQGTVHNGLYSLQTGWIDKPQKIAPTDNDAAVEAKYNEIKELVDKCDDSEEATELLEKIYNMRKAGLAEAGEFCTENLAFKKLRNEGCMDKLRQIKKEQIDKQLSLESYNEDNTLKDIIDRLINIGLQIDGSYKDYKPSEIKYAKEVMDIAVKKGFVFKEQDQYKKEISQSFAKLRYDLLNDKQVIEIANKAKKDIDKQLSLESYNESETQAKLVFDLTNEDGRTFETDVDVYKDEDGDFYCNVPKHKKLGKDQKIVGNTIKILQDVIKKEFEKEGYDVKVKSIEYPYKNESIKESEETKFKKGDIVKDKQLNELIVKDVIKGDPENKYLVEYIYTIGNQSDLNKYRTESELEFIKGKRLIELEKILKTNTSKDNKNESINKLEETLKRVKDMEINEGMWASPFTMENAKQIAELLAKPITYEELNSEEGKQKVWNIIGDDEFWDNVADEAFDNPEEDARYLIVKFLEDWMERKESFNNDAYSQEAENIIKKAIFMFNGITEDMATLEKKVDAADNDLHDIITSLENSIKEALE